MTKEVFLQEKERLSGLINVRAQQPGLTTREIESIKRINEILAKYTYDNRLAVKGLIAHTVVDSLELGYSVSEELIGFDNRIT